MADPADPVRHPWAGQPSTALSPPPDSPRLAWWYAAWLRGNIDQPRRHGRRRSSPTTPGHHIADVGARGPRTKLTPRSCSASATLRNLGTTTGTVSPTRPRRPSSAWAGRADFVCAALEQGEAVVLGRSGLGLVPVRGRPRRRFAGEVPLPAQRRQLVDLGEAGRGYRNRGPGGREDRAVRRSRCRPLAARRRRRAAQPPPHRTGGLGRLARRSAAVALTSRGIHGLAPGRPRP